MAVKVRYKQSAGALGIASNGTTPVTLLTFGTGLVMPDEASGPGGIIDRIRVYNADTVTQTVQLHAIPSGDAADNDTMIDKVTLAPGEVYHYLGGDRMPSSAFIQVKLGAAHTTNPVYAKVDVSEMYSA